MDVSYIMDSGQNRLYTTFPNIFSLLSADPADLSHIQKNHFHEKIPYFLKKTVVVPSPHEHSLQTHKIRFLI